MADRDDVQQGFAQSYPQLAWWVRHEGWIESSLRRCGTVPTSSVAL